MEFTETPDQVRRYLGKLSGPLLDRMDLRVAMQPVSPEALTRLPAGETSDQVRQRIQRAWQIQLQRQGVFNSRLEVAALEHVAGLSHADRQLLEKLITQLDLSARAYVRLLRVARTLADLEAADAVGGTHIQEAVSLRRLPGGLL